MDTQKTSMSTNGNTLKHHTILSDFARDWQLYLMFLPVLVYLLIFNYAPLYGLKMAFQNYKPFLGISGSEWVGLEHFKNFFTGPYAWRIIRNTVQISLYSLVAGYPLTIILALLLNEIRHNKLKSTLQTIYYMPHFISAVVVAGVVISILSPSSGIVNMLIEKLGGERINFLYEAKYFKTIYITTGLWQNLGYSTIIYTSAMCAIDESLYEAADIDGAGRIRKMWHVTIPGILPTMVTMLILNIGQLLSVGSEMILLLYQPITYESADVISTFVYRYGMELGDYSFSTAVGMFNGVIGFFLVWMANTVSKKVNETSLW